MKVVIRSDFKYCNYKLLGRNVIDYVVQAATDAGFETIALENISDFKSVEGEDYIIIPGDAALITKEDLLSFCKKYTHIDSDSDSFHNIGKKLFRIDSPLRYAEAIAAMRMRINGLHMNNGVIITDPLRTDIDADVLISTGTVIYPDCFLEGSAVIGCDCVIGPSVKLSSSKIGDGTEIMYSVVTDATIGNSAHIGPYTYIRPGSFIGDGCRIGDFVEIKNSVIGDGTKISHLTYVGDSDVGKGVNFGCGSVTVNYDGKLKHRTTIGSGAFIGCNTNLVAPVTLGENAFTAAGSTITADVPDNSLGIARARQENKQDWVLRRKQD